MRLRAPVNSPSAWSHRPSGGGDWVAPGASQPVQLDLASTGDGVHLTNKRGCLTLRMLSCPFVLFVAVVLRRSILRTSHRRLVATKNTKSRKAAGPPAKRCCRRAARTRPRWSLEFGKKLNDL